MIILNPRRRAYRPCLVFNAVTGKSYGYTNANQLKSGERIEDLSAYLDFPARQLAYYNFCTGVLTSYQPILVLPPEVKVLFDNEVI